MAIAAVSETGNAGVDALLGGTKWTGGQITFGFSESALIYTSRYGNNEPSSGFSALTNAQKAAARLAMSLWDELIALDLVETSGANATIRLAASSAPSTAWAYLPSSWQEGGDIWFGRSNWFDTPTPGSYGFHTFVHEIGHALGLTHPHENALARAASGFLCDDTSQEAALVCPCCAGSVHGAGGVTLPGAQSGVASDVMAHSIMSYKAYVGDVARGYENEQYGFAQTPMLYDILAIQHLYGANYTTRAGDTVYSWDPVTGARIVDGVIVNRPGGGKVFETLWDGGGNDTIDLSGFSTDVVINLQPGGWIDFGNNALARVGPGKVAPGNVALAFDTSGQGRAVIENARGGSGDDLLIGNAYNNVLAGGAGDDRIVAVAGDNILAGGAIGDMVIQMGLMPAALASIAQPFVEYFDGDDVLEGGSGNDIFIAGSGRDIMIGGGGYNIILIDENEADVSVAMGASGSLLLSFTTGTIAAQQINAVVFRDGAAVVPGAATVFSSELYLMLNPDVATAVAEGWIASAERHFLDFGIHEGRSGASTHAAEGFSSKLYLMLNPDVAAALAAGWIASAEQHFLDFGIHEGRLGGQTREMETAAVTPDYARHFEGWADGWGPLFMA
jgi:serralysin